MESINPESLEAEEVLEAEPPDDELEGHEPQLCSKADDQNINPESLEAEILPPPDDELQYSEDDEPEHCSPHGASLQLYDGAPPGFLQQCPNYEIQNEA